MTSVPVMYYCVPFQPCTVAFAPLLPASGTKGSTMRRPPGDSRATTLLVVGLSVICVLLMYNYYATAAERNATSDDLQLQVLKYQALEMEKREVIKRNEALTGELASLKASQELTKARLQELQADTERLGGQLKTVEEGKREADDRVKAEVQRLEDEKRQEVDAVKTQLEDASKDAEQHKQMLDQCSRNLSLVHGEVEKLQQQLQQQQQQQQEQQQLQQQQQFQQPPQQAVKREETANSASEYRSANGSAAQSAAAGNNIQPPAVQQQQPVDNNTKPGVQQADVVQQPNAAASAIPNVRPNADYVHPTGTAPGAGDDKNERDVQPRGDEQQRQQQQVDEATSPSAPAAADNKDGQQQLRMPDFARLHQQQQDVSPAKDTGAGKSDQQEQPDDKELMDRDAAALAGPAAGAPDAREAADVDVPKSAPRSRNQQVLAEDVEADEDDGDRQLPRPDNNNRAARLPFESNRLANREVVDDN